MQTLCVRLIALFSTLHYCFVALVQPFSFSAAIDSRGAWFFIGCIFHLLSSLALSDLADCLICCFPQKSAGGVLWPKSVVKYERYLIGEVWNSPSSFNINYHMRKWTNWRNYDQIFRFFLLVLRLRKWRPEKRYDYWPRVHNVLFLVTFNLNQTCWTTLKVQTKLLSCYSLPPPRSRQIRVIFADDDVSWIIHFVPSTLVGYSTHRCVYGHLTFHTRVERSALLVTSVDFRRATKCVDSGIFRAGYFLWHKCLWSGFRHGIEALFLQREWSLGSSWVIIPVW